jgi:ATP-dependent Lon protease
MDDSIREKLIHLLYRREALLAIHSLGLKNVFAFGRNSPSEAVAEMQTVVHDLLERYPASYRDALKSFLTKIRINSDINNKAQRAVGYIWGPPGTGKTRFVNDMANSLNIPLCSLTMKDVQEEFTGGSFDDTSKIGVDEESFYGKLLMCIMKSGVRNPIIFIDEAGESFKKATDINTNHFDMSFWKKFLDPNAVSVKLWTYGKVDFDISRVTIILAGNYEPDEGLAGKISVLWFDKVSSDVKRNIANVAKEEVLLSMKQHIDEIFYSRVEELMDKMIPYILSTEVDSGVRTIESIIRNYGNFLLYNIMSGDSVSEEASREFIDKQLHNAFRRTIATTESILTKEEATKSIDEIAATPISHRSRRLQHESSGNSRSKKQRIVKN